MQDTDLAFKTLTLDEHNRKTTIIVSVCSLTCAWYPHSFRLLHNFLLCTRLLLLLFLFAPLHHHYVDLGTSRPIQNSFSSPYGQCLNILADCVHPNNALLRLVFWPVLKRSISVLLSCYRWTVFVKMILLLPEHSLGSYVLGF